MRAVNLKKLFLYSENDSSDFELNNEKESAGFNPQMNEGGPQLSGCFRQDIDTLSRELMTGQSGDLKTREFTVRIAGREVKAIIYFVDGLVDKQLVNDFILRPLMITSRSIEISSYKQIFEMLIPQCEASQTNVLGELEFNINFGSVILLVDGMRKAVSIDVKGWEHRGVDSPQTERVIRGPNDAFSEQLRENTALIRHLIRNKSLVSKEFMLGTISQTPVSVMYIENIANESLVRETLRRVSNIEADYIFAAAELEQFLEDKTFSSLPQFLSTERPDRAARALLSGRIVIVVDGSPFVSILPTTVFELNESAEDSYLRFPYSNMIKTIRWIAFLLSMFLPGLYVAIISYHAELLPTDLLMSIVATREKVPFPTVVELIIMEISLEIIRSRRQSSRSLGNNAQHCRSAYSRSGGCQRRNRQPDSDNNRVDNGNRIVHNSQLLSWACRKAPALYLYCARGARRIFGNHRWCIYQCAFVVIAQINGCAHGSAVCACNKRRNPCGALSAADIQAGAAR